MLFPLYLAVYYQIISVSNMSKSDVFSRYSPAKGCIVNPCRVTSLYAPVRCSLVQQCGVASCTDVVQPRALVTGFNEYYPKGFSSSPPSPLPLPPPCDTSPIMSGVSITVVREAMCLPYLARTQRTWRENTLL